MALEYEKHQRDYTVLATSIVFDEFFSKRMYKFFPFKPHRMYIMIKNGTLYHFMAKADYNNWAQRWNNEHNMRDLKSYINTIDKKLIEYKIFLKIRHGNPKKSIIKLNKYIRDFLPIIAITAYVPMYGKNIDKDINGLCLETRRRYEDVHKIGIDLQSKLLKKIEKNNNLKNNTLRYLSSSEFNLYIKRGVLPTDLQLREEFMWLEQGMGTLKIYTGKKARNKAQKIYDNRGGANTKSLKGKTAFPGRCRGRVRLIKLIKDIRKMRKGEILITAMTDPRYLLAMKKAAAIVTNEGGITCHAAIVSRELKIPCIVGTKSGTHTFNDGDLVEVDAERGIVRKLYF